MFVKKNRCYDTLMCFGRKSTKYVNGNNKIEAYICNVEGIH